jgi:cytochrome c-type biogenesis protein CcmF
MNMPFIGHLALILALLSAAYTAAAGFWAHKTGDVRLRESARGAAVGIALSMTAAVFALEYLLVTGDFSVAAVFNHTNRGLPLAYRLAALWGGDSGSVLFWGWLLSLYTAWVAGVGFKAERRITALAIPILALMLVFFAGVSNVAADPFRLIAGNPTNGSGLDPLLQNPVMVIHPPAMYTGLIGIGVPFALFMSALWQRLPSDAWTPLVRRWLLFAWMFLSAAIILGGWWAYMELGWGGYWEWDPVENASLLPWLAATGFLHTLQAQEKRGMLRTWSAGLVVAAFLLTQVGTYITRSGVLPNSVHSFAGTGVGPWFFGLFWVGLVASLVVLYLRRDQLTDRQPLHDTFSREGVLFLVAFVSAVLVVVVEFGTFYPIISKALLGTTVVLRIGFFNTMTVPLFLALVLLMGMAPAMSWRSTKLHNVVQRLRWAWIIGLAGGVAAYIWGARTPALFLGDTLAVFALAATVQEFTRAASIRRRATGERWGWALLRAVNHNRRKFGAYVAHAAFLIIVLGVVGSHTGNYSVVKTFRVGQTEAVGPYRVTFQGLETVPHGTYETTRAALVVNGGGLQQVSLTPGLEFFPGSSQPVAHVAIQGGWMQDLYTVLVGYSPGGTTANVEFFVNPMVSWIWIGMYIIVLGSLLTLLGGGRPRPRARSLAVPGPVWRERRDEA